MASLRATAVRDVDKLLPMTDINIAIKDKEYLDKHMIEPMFKTLITDLVTMKPLDPVQYIIDSIQFGPEYAKQDPKTGLPEYRREKLLSIFQVMDRASIGKVSFGGLQEFADRHGGNTLTQEDLGSIFKDFKPQEESLIDQEQFLLFFAKVSRTITNSGFTELVQSMMA